MKIDFEKVEAFDNSLVYRVVENLTLKHEKILLTAYQRGYARGYEHAMRHSREENNEG